MKFRTEAIVQIEDVPRIREIEIEFEVQNLDGHEIVMVSKTQEVIHLWNRDHLIGADWLWDAISLPASQKLDRLMLRQWRERRAA